MEGGGEDLRLRESESGHKVDVRAGRGADREKKPEKNFEKSQKTFGKVLDKDKTL